MSVADSTSRISGRFDVGLLAAILAFVAAIDSKVSEFIAESWDAFWDTASEAVPVYRQYQRNGLRETAACRAGQDRDIVGVMLLVVIAVVIGFVGLTVMSSVQDTTSFSTGSAFSNASDSLESAVDTVFGLVEVVFIAIVLGLIIGALLFLRRRQ